MKKITKKEIKRVLRTQETTEIFRTAVKCGVDVSNRRTLYLWIRANAPSQKVHKKAYNIAYGSNKNYSGGYIHQPIKKAVEYAKYQKNRGVVDSYSKKLKLGNKNIYWCSLIYGHKDYNKTIAFPNTPENRQKMYKINRFLGF